MTSIDKNPGDPLLNKGETVRYNKFQVFDDVCTAFGIEEAEKQHAEMSHGRYIVDMIPFLESRNISHERFKTILTKFSKIDFLGLKSASNEMLKSYMGRDVSTSIDTYANSRISFFSTLLRINPDVIESNIAKISSPEWQSKIKSEEYIQAVSWMGKLGHSKYTHPVNSNYFVESNENNLAVLIASDDKLSKVVADPAYYEVEDLEYFSKRQRVSLFNEITDCTPEELVFATQANKHNRLNSFGVEQLIALYRKGIIDPEIIGPALNLYTKCNSGKPSIILSDSVGGTTISLSFIDNANAYLPKEDPETSRTTKDIILELSSPSHSLWKYQEKSKIRSKQLWTRDQLIKACYQEPNIRTLIEKVIDLPINDKSIAIFNNIVQLSISKPEYCRDHANEFFVFTPEVSEGGAVASATATAEFLAAVIQYTPQSESITSLFTKQSLMELPSSTVYDLINAKVLLEEDLGPVLVERYYDINPEAREQIKLLKQQSESEEWDHDIHDRISFWRKNEKIFAYAYESGFKVKDFSQFRSMILNKQVIEMFEMPSMTCSAMRDLSTRVGVNEKNITYLNPATLTIVSNNLDRTQTVKYYRFLLNSNPRIFINTLYSFDKCKLTVEKYLVNKDYVKRFESAVSVVGNITPDLVKNYVLEEDSTRRDKYLAIISNYHQKVFLNEPILDSVTPDQYSILANEICLTFPGTTYQDILYELDHITDRCDDISDLVIRKSGYTPDIKTEELVVVRNQGERVNEKFVNHVDSSVKQVKSLLESSSLSEEDEKILIQILKDSGSSKIDEWESSRYLLPILTTVIDYNSNQTYFDDIRLDTTQASSVDRYLERLESILGVHYNDNSARVFADKITEPGRDLTRKFGQLITPKRLAQIKRNIGDKSALPSDQLDQLFQRLENNSLASELQDPSDIGALISIIIESQFLNGKDGLRSYLKSERSKYHYESLKGEYVDPNLVITGFVTKNAAAYYAKFTAGICTAGDRELYNRSDHFDVVLAIGDRVIGDIQVYRVTYEDKPALLFRGFNPSNQIVNKTNAAYLSKQMIAIAKMIADDNKIAHSFIPPQDEWHPLTNRVAEGVEEYFLSTYMSSNTNPVDLHVELTTGKEIDKAYMIF